MISPVRALLAGPPVGVFGGTFDPIHFGHLRLAQELGEGLKLGEVRFIPTGCPPHRNAPRMSAAERLDMVRLAIVDNPLFSLDDREVRREGVCYTFDTLTSLRAELGEGRPIVLLMGADALFGLCKWHRWRELFGLAHLAVAHRPGFSLSDHLGELPEEVRAEVFTRFTQGALPADEPAGRVVLYPFTPLEISASRIRALLGAGQSPRYLLPDVVLDYIRTHRIYT